MIVNEFGETGVDNELVVDADEEIFGMNNGCICCTVRGDLIPILGGLMKRRDFDGILIETTGMADPAPVAQTFFVDEDVAARTRLDAIVTVVDAVNLATHLDEAHEAAEQIAFADVILLNKTDLADAEDIAAVERRIRAINPYARIVHSARCAVPLDQVIGLDAFSLDRVLAVEPGFLTEDHAHKHEDDITSVSLAADRPLDPVRFQDWFGRIIQRFGTDILRAKGILNLAGEDRRYVMQGVHMLIEANFLGRWAPGPRTSKLVFIGHNLSDMPLAEGLKACEVD